jgi:hypothetical protein
VPNCAVELRSCALNAWSTADWMVAAGVDGSKIRTFGPRSGVSEVGRPGPLVVVVGVGVGLETLVKTWNSQSE